MQGSVASRGFSEVVLHEWFFKEGMGKKILHRWFRKGFKLEKASTICTLTEDSPCSSPITCFSPSKGASKQKKLIYLFIVIMICVEVFILLSLFELSKAQLFNVLLLFIGIISLLIIELFIFNNFFVSCSKIEKSKRSDNPCKQSDNHKEIITTEE